MILYGPEHMLKERIKEAEKILEEIPAKSVFITGSFLFSKSYKDIDVFVVTRSRKEFRCRSKRARITKISFNNLHSLFYHSASKSCAAKNILPSKKLRATIADFWSIVNEAVPMIFNEKTDFRKDIRYLVMYTDYFLTGNILDSYDLTQKINGFRNYRDALEYINTNVPYAVLNKANTGYIRRFFYTQSGFYKGTLNYESHRYLYDLSHAVARVSHGS